MHLKISILVSMVFGLLCICSYMDTNNLDFRLIAPRDVTKLPNENLGNTRRYLSFHLEPKTRLGNHLFELSSLLGISRALNRTPVVFVENGHLKKMIRDTRKAMPGLVDQLTIVNDTLPSTYQSVIFNPRCCVYENPNVLSAIDHQFLHLDGRFYQSFKYFSKHRNKLLGYLKKPPKQFKNLPVSSTLCIHTRKGDFSTYDFASTDESFVKKAVNYIQSKRKNSLKNIIIFGDDLKFMKNIFNDTVLSNHDSLPRNSRHFVSQNSPSEDLIYSKNYCDIVLISAPHSTFGWWMGYVSKGNKVYYMDIRETNDRVYRSGNINPVDYYPSHWRPLKLTPDGTEVIES